MRFSPRCIFERHEPEGSEYVTARPRLLRLLLALGLWLPAAALAAVIFAADFEAPSYALGPLHGQAGWTEQGGSGVRYSVVPNTLPGFASAGAQTLSMEGGGVAGGWIRSPVWNGITGGTVLLEAGILPNPAKTTGVFLGNVGTGAGAYLFFESDGTLHVWNGAGMTGTGTPYAARPYHLKLMLDIDGGTYAVELDGVPFLSGLDARSNPGPGEPVETLELFSGAGNFDDFSYIDNLVVSHGVPSPGPLMLILGALLACAVVRRPAARASRPRASPRPEFWKVKLREQFRRG